MRGGIVKPLALPLWESTRAESAVRGQPRSGVRNKDCHPPPFPPCVALRAPGRKPSPTRGEGDSMRGGILKPLALPSWESTRAESAR